MKTNRMSLVNRFSLLVREIAEAAVSNNRFYSFASGYLKEIGYSRTKSYTTTKLLQCDQRVRHHRVVTTSSQFRSNNRTQRVTIYFALISVMRWSGQKTASEEAATPTASCVLPPPVKRISAVHQDCWRYLPRSQQKVDSIVLEVCTGPRCSARPGPVDKK